MNSFSELGLREPLLRAVREQGYETPTPIQVQAIPHVLAGRDVLGCAQTGTGKTAAFALPLLDRLAAEPAPDASRPRAPRALVVSPTRELAGQIGEDVRNYGRHLRLTSTVIFGGVSQMHQVNAIRRGVDSLELSVVTQYLLELAQKFNSFYHKYPILNEKDPIERQRRAACAEVFRRTMVGAMDLLGIPVPQRM